MAAVLFQFGLSNVVFSLERLGFFQLLFPFLLSLAIVYGILNWALGDKMGKSPTALISIVISFFVMLYAATNPFIVGFLTTLSGTTLIVGVGLLMLAVLFGLVGIKIGDIQNKGSWVFYAIILIIIYIVATVAFGSVVSPILINNDFWAVIFFIVVLLLAVKYLGGGGGGEAKPAAAPEKPKG